MKKLIQHIALASVLTTGSLLAQSFNKPKLDSLLTNLDSEQQGMGCVTITQQGKVLYNRAFGYEKITESQAVKATPATKYRIGSISKMITATIILQLIEEGKLSLDTPLATFYPTVPNAQKITIAHLLNHRSGISDIKERQEFHSDWMNTPHTEAEVLHLIESASIKHQPDEHGEYSNSGFILLSYIVQKVGKAPYQSILNERICKKIGLKNTYYEATRGTRPNEAFSYQWQQDKWVQMPETDLSIPSGAGGIVSTTADLCRIVEAIFTYQLVSKKSVDYMKIIKDGYGSGLFEFPFNNQNGYGHNGDIDGFSSFSLYFPAAQMAVSYFTNGKVYSKDDILRAILKIYFNQSYQVPSFELMNATIHFVVDMNNEIGRVNNRATIGIRGNAEPLSWDKTYPMTDDNHDGIYETTLTVKSRGALEYKYHYDNAVWEQGQNHRLNLKNGMNEVQEAWKMPAELKQLYDEILKADSLLFEEGYNKQNISQMQKMFSPDLEFYHDKTGLTNYADNIEAFKSNFSRNLGVRRELLREGMEIFPVPNYGAIQVGLHRFCHVENGKNDCGTFKFMSIWKKTNGEWKVTRIVSYNH
ncbi:MAG: serine hydrolase [Spirosomataceae bacterium]